MQTENTELALVKSTNLTCVASMSNVDEFSDCLGGIINNGNLGWIANGPNLDVFSLKTRSRVASYTFEHHLNTVPSLITCVTEIEIPDCKTCILAVGIQFQEIGGMICIFSVLGSRVLESIEIAEKIICSSFIPQNVINRSRISYFDGGLVYGTETGKVFLVDLFLRKCNEVLCGVLKLKNEIDLTPTHNILADVDVHELKCSVKRCRKENVHCSVQLQVLNDSGPVLSMLIIPQQMTLVIGLYDGRMILYDFCDLQAYHLAYPPEMNSPLVKMCYIEPADDPRACLYVWALHYNSKSTIAVMHSIMFERKITDNHNDIFYENFQSCGVRLTIPFMDPGSRPLACQSITKTSSFDEEDEIISICFISWESVENQKTNLLVFDLNQWYKEQMPEILNLQSLSNCLVFLSMNKRNGLDLWSDVKTLTSFNSIQRPEEHFYPSALNFDCIFLTPKSFNYFSRIGLQNQAIQYMNTQKSKCVFEPHHCYKLLVQCALFPQSWDELLYSKKTPSIKLQREFILSVALENHCIGLLKDCNKLWADGSHLGNDNTIDGLSLSTLTDWLWSRAQSIKEYCNNLCVPLFDHTQIQIDNRTKKQLTHCSKQLKLLANLLEMILNINRANIPEEIQNKLTLQLESLKTSYEYQELLQWLLNTDILPEGVYTPYPYDILREFYSNQRYKFQQIRRTTTQYCPFLYIDKFIENECNSKALKLQWKETNGSYPPVSLQEMLRIMLIPKITNDTKYTLVLYLFLDLSVALEDGQHDNVIENLIKFPSVFMLKPSLIKRTQAFWKLDHGQFEPALDELFSPLSGSKPLSSWQFNFLIETLLVQELPQLALRCIRASDSPLNFELHIKTLLSNDCISEAFQVQRSKGDSNLLKEFFKIIFSNRKWKFLLDFALTEAESKVLCEFLNEINSNISENFHIIYLLQRSKYIDAIRLIEKIQKRNHYHLSDTENPNLILSAYNVTMTPAVKTISKSYFAFDRIGNNKESSSIQPFSKHLINTKVDSPQDLHKLTFDYIKNYHSTDVKGQNPNNSIPFLEKPFYEKISLLDKNRKTVIPKLIEKGEIGKRKLHLDYDDRELLKDFEQPRKKHLHETDYKTKLLTDFRERNQSYDFSSTKQNIFNLPKQDQSPKLLKTPMIERNFDRITDSPSHGILKSVDSPISKRPSVERSIKFNFSKTTQDVDELFLFGRTNNSSNVSKISQVLKSDEFVTTKKTDEEFFGIEEKITPEMWNDHPAGKKNKSISTTKRSLRSSSKIESLSPSKISKIDNDNSDVINVETPNSSLVEPKVKSPHPLFVEEKITAEVWNAPIINSVLFTIGEQQSNLDLSSRTGPKKRRGLRYKSKTLKHPTRRTTRSRSRTPEALSQITKPILEKSTIETISEEKDEPEKMDVDKIPVNNDLIENPVNIQDLKRRSIIRSSEKIEKYTEAVTIVSENVDKSPQKIINSILLETVDDSTKIYDTKDDDNDDKDILNLDDTSINVTNSSTFFVVPRPRVLDDDSNYFVEKEPDSDSEMEMTYYRKQLFDDSYVENEETEETNIVLEAETRVDTKEDKSENSNVQNEVTEEINIVLEAETRVDAKEDKSECTSNPDTLDIEDLNEEDFELSENLNSDEDKELDTTVENEDDQESVDDNVDDDNDDDDDDVDEETDDDNEDDDNDDDEDDQVESEIDNDDEELGIISEEDNCEEDDYEDDEDDYPPNQSTPSNSNEEIINISSSDEDEIDIPEKLSDNFEDVDEICLPNSSKTSSNTIQEEKLITDNTKSTTVQDEPVIPATETEKHISSLLYDSIDMDMTSSDEPDNLNNALIIDFTYSQDSQSVERTEYTSKAQETIIEDKSTKNDNLNDAMILSSHNDETVKHTDNKNISEDNVQIIVENSEKSEIEENAGISVNLLDDGISSVLINENQTTTVNETNLDADVLNQAFVESSIENVDVKFDTPANDTEKMLSIGDKKDLPEVNIEIVKELSDSHNDVNMELNEKTALDELKNIKQSTKAIDIEISKENEKFEPSTSKSSDNIEISIPSNKYSLRNTRARSIDQDTPTTPKRSKRATSVPKQVVEKETTVGLRRTTRSNSTDHTPKKFPLLKSDLEKINENEVLTPSTPTQTRRKSITAHTTPRRNSITKSTDLLNENIIIGSPMTRSRKRSSSIDIEIKTPEPTTTRNLRSNPVSKTLSPEEMAEKLQTEHKDSDLLESRRLTRHQLAVMEKMEEFKSNPIKTPSKSKRSKKKLVAGGNDHSMADVSDGESIVSTPSSEKSTTSKRSTRSRTSRSSNKSKLMEKFDVDEGNLQKIEEEPENDDPQKTSNKTAKKRERKASSSK